MFKVHRSAFAKDSDRTASTTVYPGEEGYTYHVAIDDPASAYGVTHPTAAPLRLAAGLFSYLERNVYDLGHTSPSASPATTCDEYRLRLNASAFLRRILQ